MARAQELIRRREEQATFAPLAAIMRTWCTQLDNYMSGVDIEKEETRKADPAPGPQEETPQVAQQPQPSSLNLH